MTAPTDARNDARRMHSEMTNQETRNERLSGSIRRGRSTEDGTRRSADSDASSRRMRRSESLDSARRERRDLAGDLDRRQVSW